MQRRVDKNMETSFQCDCCGLCCMNLKSNVLYQDLDRGDGICKFFNMTDKLCNVYRNRPVKCNIDEFYNIYMKNTMSREEYYKINYDICKKLKEDDRCI